MQVKVGTILGQMLEPEQANRINSSTLNEIMSTFTINSDITIRDVTSMKSVASGSTSSNTINNTSSSNASGKSVEVSRNANTKNNESFAIQLIEFSKFKSHGSFPRNPDNKNILTTLDRIDRDKSFVVFISHCWLRGAPGTVGYDGRPHPDNATNDKYKLCIKGIEQVRDSAPRFKDCYIWMDYGCLDQNDRQSGFHAGRRKQLNKIIECSDVIFTPIFDPNYSTWNYPFGWSNHYTEYKAAAWNDGPNSYVNRAWCRVEMFYAANIPIMGNKNGVARYTQFEAGLRILTEQGHRPHIMYGTKEESENRIPWVLQPLQNSYQKLFSPLEGSFSHVEDQDHVVSILEELKPYMKELTHGFVGPKDGNGKPHGRGVFTYENGSVYDGEFVHGTREGKGLLTYANGDRYGGDFRDDKFNGHGHMVYSGQGTYDGEFKDGSFYGDGKFTYPTGQVAIMKNGQCV